MTLIVREVELAELTSNPWNPRRFERDQELESLADSIRAQGVLQPLVVRPNGKGYEIVAGERRFRAAQLAGLEAVPVLVRELSDEEALEVTVVENLQRRDLHPLEEAQGIQLLLEKRGWSAETVATEIGRSLAFVARRARIAKLSPRWQKLASDRKHPASELSASHLEIVAQLEPESQDALLGDWPFRNTGDSSAWRNSSIWWARYVGEAIQKLSAAPWKLSDAELLPAAGPCLTCPKRASANPGLFDDVAGAEGAKIPKNDRCLDPACWDRKLEAFVGRRFQELVAEHGDQVLIVKRDRGGHETVLPHGEGLKPLDHWNYDVAKKTDPKARPALVVGGSGIGSLIWAKVLERSGSGAKRATLRAPSSLAERKKKLERRRIVHATALVDKALRETIAAPALQPVVRLAALVGTEHKFDSSAWEGYWPGEVEEHFIKEWRDLLAAGRGQVGKGRRLLPAFRNLEGYTAHQVLWLGVRAVLLGRLAYKGSHHDLAALWDSAELVCEVLELDAPKFLHAAKEAIPEPKTWAKLAAAEAEAKRGKRKGKKATKTRKAAGGER